MYFKFTGDSLFDHPEVEEVWLIGCKHPVASPALPH